MPETEARKKWTKENTVFIGLKLQKTTDREILEFLEGRQNQTEFKKAMYYYIAHQQEVEAYEAERTQTEGES